jgi:hypothetical protein
MTAKVETSGNNDSYKSPAPLNASELSPAGIRGAAYPPDTIEPMLARTPGNDERRNTQATSKPIGDDLPPFWRQTGCGRI